MKRAVAFLFAAVFFTAAASIWVNGPLVESWLAERFVVEEDDEQPLVGLQNEEHWLVVVVEFSDHPATEAWGTDEAENLMEQAAAPYIEQMSAGTSTLSIHIHPTVVRATEPLAAYGSDGSDKDTDESGQFLPMTLAEETVNRIENEVNWSLFDLNGDSVVDRFLILHTSKGQEENPGIKQRIWSHFTRFDDAINVGEGHTVEHYTMASLQTGSSGVGTMLHEMLHQMGAVDLYPVHDESSFQDWKGPGNWDIMASGNWNGGGRWPALPTGATLELIGAPQIQELDLQWPDGASTPCIGPSIVLEGTSQEGMVLKINIAEHEAVFIEYRSNHGYDERLPGHGVLVTYQDLSVGDFEQNELNTNPDLPWLKVIEADEGNDLVSGANQGEATDLFTNNTTFGAEGVEIRTHDGLLVPWTAEVLLLNETVNISFRANDCSPTFQLNLPDHGATVLPEQAVEVDLSGAREPCTSSLISTDGRGVAFTETNDGEKLVFSSRGTPNSVFEIQGTITCDGHTVNLAYLVRTMNRIPQVAPFETTIDPFAKSSITLPLASEGGGQQNLAVHLDGPLSRVADAPPSVNLDDGELTLTIDPNGLLVDNMLVHGTVELMTEEGISWTVDITLRAEQGDSNWLPSWVSVGQILALLMALGGIYSLMSAFQQTEAKPSPSPDDQSSVASTQAIDPWGRPVDEDDSTNSFDVEI